MASGEQGRRTAWNWVLRGISLIIAAGLAVDAFVHFDLASTYAETGGAISEGTLFRAEAVVALVTAHAVVLTRHRACYLLAFGVAASALTAMIVSRYADLGPIGPFPDLYDPAWFPEKVLAAFGESAAVVASAVGIFLFWIAGRRAARARTQSPIGRPAERIRPR